MSQRDEILVKIEQEKFELEQQLENLVGQIQQATDKLAKEEGLRDAAWLAVEKSIPKKNEGKLDYADSTKVTEAETADRCWHAASGALDNLLRLRNKHKAQIVKLDQPGEVERRLEQAEKLQKLRDKKKEEKELAKLDSLDSSKPQVTRPKKVIASAKEQGFPICYLRDNGAFRAGFDSVAKHDLIAAMLKLKEPVLHKFTPAQATKLLELRNWTSFVTKKQKALDLEKKRAERKVANAKKKAAKTSKS